MEVVCLVRDCQYQENNLCLLDTIVISETTYHHCDSYKYKVKEYIYCKHLKVARTGNHRHESSLNKFDRDTSNDRFNNCWKLKESDHKE